MSFNVDTLRNQLDDAERNGNGDYHPTWHWENPGDQVLGRVAEIRDVETHYGPTRVMTLEQEDKTKIDLFLSNAVLARALCATPIGHEVAVRYLGNQQSEKTGRTYANFAVVVRPPDPQAVPLEPPPGLPPRPDFG